MSQESGCEQYTRNSKAVLKFFAEGPLEVQKKEEEKIARCLEIKRKYEKAIGEIIEVRKRKGMPVDDKATERIEKNVKHHLGYDSHVEAVLKNYKTKL